MKTSDAVDRRTFIAGLGSLCAGSLVAGSLGAWAESPLVGSPVKRGALSGTVVGGRIKRAKLEESVRLACRWMTDIAQIKTEKLVAGKEVNATGFPYTNWKGAIRGEYSPARETGGEELAPKVRIPARTWFFFCPIWHTGQAVKALSLAYRYFGERAYLDSAKLGADFLRRQQNSDRNSPDFGCIAAFEDHNDIINTSAIFECCGGLFSYAEASGDQSYADAAMDAINWAVKRLYNGGGLFIDGYDPVKKATSTQGWTDKFGVSGRPLIDDGVIFTAWQRNHDAHLREVFYEIADRLVAKEEPRGNWVNYYPSNWKTGYMHPRNAFWWGRPMWMAFKNSGDAKYRRCFENVCDWYAQAMRHDGGMLRNTFRDFSTDSFGHATSGVGCACMLFHDAYTQLGDEKYLPKLALGLNYMMSMQVTKAVDPNMQGVIIEKAYSPNGSDTAAWHVRDLGTIFFVTSACQTLLDIGE